MKPVACISFLTIALGTLPAAPITGLLWQVSNDIASDAILANVPSTPPDVTFEVNAPLNFNNGTTVMNFLNSGGAFNIVGDASDLSRPISPSLIEFMGQVTVTTGQQFTVTHDDGLTLIIGGLEVIGVPGPTGPIQTTRTYSGPSGNFPFTLVYGECCSGSAVLQIDLPFQPTPAVPEPATISLATGGLLFVAYRLRSRREAS